MDTDKLDEYQLVLKEILNNRYTPITPKRMKELFGMNDIPNKTNEYDTKKTSLQRILDFYNSAKIITIVTDTTLNEINRLKKMKGDVKISLKERNKLKPYIQLLNEKNYESSKSQLDDCIKYTTVTKEKEKELVYVTNKGKKVDESLLPSNYDDIEKGKNGYRVIAIDGKEIKVKHKFEEKSFYQLVGAKFENIDINFFEEKIKTSEGEILKLCIENVVDLDDIEISPYNIMYRLFLECDFKDERGNIDSPIEFQIPNDNIGLFVEFFVSMVKMFDYDIKSNKIVTLSKSDTFQNTEVKEFVTNIVTKMLIKLTEFQKGEDSYPLQLLLDLISFNSKINIKMNIDDEEVNLSKTTIKKIIVKENGIDLKFKHSLISLSNINQIKSILSYDTNGLKEDIDKLRTILTEYPTEVSNPITELIEGLENIEDIFLF